jgi:hypothetical protein
MEVHAKDSIQEIALFSFHHGGDEKENEKRREAEEGVSRAIYGRIKCECHEILGEDYDAGRMLGGGDYIVLCCSFSDDAMLSLPDRRKPSVIKPIRRPSVGGSTTERANKRVNFAG